MPTIFVKFQDEKHVELAAGPDATFRSVVEQAYRQLRPHDELPPDDKLKIFYDGKLVAKTTLTLGDLNVQAYKTISVELPARREDAPIDNVLAKLQAFLRLSAGELGSDEMTFIGIGCFDHGHGEDSIKRQQCPDSLLQYCIRQRVDLNLILVDPGFADTSGRFRQIYDMPGWRLQFVEEGGRIRQYSYTPAVAAGACDVWLTVFATGIAEYTLELAGQGKLVGGISLPDVFAAAGGPHHPGACVISGNFYLTPPDSSQYFTRGSQQAIAAAGFIHNA